jgi:hypothetical protein
VAYEGAFYDREYCRYRLGGRCWRRSRGNAAALGLAMGGLGLGMNVSPDLIRPQIIAAVLTRLILLTIGASAVLLLTARPPVVGRPGLTAAAEAGCAGVLKVRCVPLPTGHAARLRDR